MIESWAISRREPRSAFDSDKVTLDIGCQAGWALQWDLRFIPDEGHDSLLMIGHKGDAGLPARHAGCWTTEMTDQVRDFFAGLVSGRLRGGDADRELVRLLTELLSRNCESSVAEDLVRKFLAFCAAEGVARAGHEVQPDA